MRVRGAARRSLRYVVHKGSITVDGISLTVAALDDDGAASPSRSSRTRSRSRRSAPIEVGARVNLEVDVIAKYVERLVQPFAAKEH